MLFFTWRVVWYLVMGYSTIFPIKMNSCFFFFNLTTFQTAEFSVKINGMSERWVYSVQGAPQGIGSPEMNWTQIVPKTHNLLKDADESTYNLESNEMNAIVKMQGEKFWSARGKRMNSKRAYEFESGDSSELLLRPLSFSKTEVSFSFRTLQIN